MDRAVITRGVMECITTYHRYIQDRRDGVTGKEEDRIDMKDEVGKFVPTRCVMEFVMYRRRGGRKGDLEWC